MAARGTRNMDVGEEPIEDENLNAQLRAKAQKIHRRALLTAVAATLLALVFP